MDTLRIQIADLVQVHDANVVATMLVHGIDAVITINLDDFTRFARHVRLIGLATTGTA